MPLSVNRRPVKKKKKKNRVETYVFLRLSTQQANTPAGGKPNVGKERGRKSGQTNTFSAPFGAEGKMAEGNKSFSPFPPGVNGVFVRVLRKKGKHLLIRCFAPR